VYDLVRGDAPAVAQLELIGAGSMPRCSTPTSGIFDQVLVIDYADVVAQPEKVYESVLRHLVAAVDLAPGDVDRGLVSDREIVSVPALTDVQRQVVYSAFRADVEELEVLLARDLSAWDPGIPPFELADEVEAVLAAVPLPWPAPDPFELDAAATGS
jgi:hypothetical protein